MDQELVQYLEERFDRQEQRFNARFDRIEQRLDSHDQKFTSIDQRFDSVDRQFALVDQRFDSTDQQLVSFDERFVSIDQRFDELKRHTGVLVEGLRQEIQHVAEGLVMHIEVRHREDRDYFNRKFDDTHALIRSSYDHLQQQQDQTRQRVENLERKSQN